MAFQCEVRNKNGSICGANAQRGKNVCVFHDPAKQADGRRARRAGGLARSAPSSRLAGGYKGVVVLLEESIKQARSGELDPRIDNTIGFLSGMLLKALEQVVVEERLGVVEAALGLLEEKQGKDGDNNR